MTPLGGVQSDLYESLYLPFQERLPELQRDRGPTECQVCGQPDFGASWAEVKPGEWVITAGMRDNAESRGGFLADERIDAYEAQLIAEGRKLEASTVLSSRAPSR